MLFLKTVRAKDLMSPNPVTCTRETPLAEVALLMMRADCGAIPVVASLTDPSPVGIVTDRDIVSRTIARRVNPLEKLASHCMSSPCVMAFEEATLGECLTKMEDEQVRRLIVVNAAGKCCGVISQADIARQAPTAKIARLLKTVSFRDRDRADAGQGAKAA